MNLQRNTSKLDKFDKISKYTLIGDYDNTRVFGKGDFGYGSSLDLKKLNEMLSGCKYKDENGKNPFVDGNTTIIPKYYAIPLFVDENQSNVSYDNLNDVAPITGWNWTIGNTTYGPTSSIEVKQARSWKANNDNIGYYVGAGCKIKKSTLSDFFNDKHDLVFYNPSTSDQISNVPSDIKDYLIEQAGDKDELYSMVLSSQQDRLKGTDDVNYIYNGTIQGTSENIVVPTRCIWIAPRYAGTFQFVFYGGTGGASLTLKKIQRRNYLNYSYGCGFDINKYNSSDNPNLLINFDSKKIEQNKLYYFSYDVSKKDIDSGIEYVLSFKKTENSSDYPYFVYMDVGQSGGGQKVNVIENVDFIKADGTGYIKTTDKGFKFSNVTFEISFTPSINKEDTYIFFFRRNSSDSTGVLFFVNRYQESQLPGYITKKGSGNYGYAKSLECNAKDPFIQ